MAGATAARPGMLSIGDLAKRTGVSGRLLRYYEAQGLLFASRTNSGHRRFDPGAEATVRSIRILLDAGVPTRLIRELIDCVLDTGQMVPCAVPILAQHLGEYDRRLARMLSTRSALQGLIDGATRASGSVPDASNPS